MIVFAALLHTIVRTCVCMWLYTYAHAHATHYIAHMLPPHAHTQKKHKLHWLAKSWQLMVSLRIYGIEPSQSAWCNY